jgi:hypothetical protein
MKIRNGITGTRDRTIKIRTEKRITGARKSAISYQEKNFQDFITFCLIKY